MSSPADPCFNNNDDSNLYSNYHREDEDENEKHDDKDSDESRNKTYRYWGIYFMKLLCL